MISDKILMLPLLSQELTLIGHSPLPYKLKKLKKTKVGSKSDEMTLKIVFDSKLMVEALSSICLELVKQIKLFGVADDNVLDKITFENAKLEKQLKLCKSEIDSAEKALAAEKESKKQLEEKISNLEKQIKNLETYGKKMALKNQSMEDILKHSLKKKDLEIIELHKILWKKFNMVDKDFLPSNFTIMQIDQPDFNKLWSEVKYSDIKTRENLLKEAIGLFQKNNKILMEDNIVLKTFLLTFLQELNEVHKLIYEKMHVPLKALFKYKIDDVCPDMENLNFPLCKNLLSEHLNLLKKICTQFERAEFSIGDDLFVCWNDVTSKLLDI